ncbi:DNA-binding transcriptional LysR family regulator [Rhizobium mesoamericanum]|uniref:LysR family transcriptional regulator n=1 Tax=Rhizobium mesoamericanum TaxID=1079800 RepID=UPI002787C89F|nr:LysR family transcriptional regulator [Rhizobium mesoamericanum]MDQ0561770.1 DNA-binding transcriptional LysR family regulator [Rhizobium mesoamericanum]
MIDWESLRYFAALARSGTLLGAARALGVEHATVARRVAGLEEQMAVKLVDRRGRRIVLTPEGERVAKMAERMEQEAQAVERLGLAAGATVAGEVRISAPPTLAAAILPAALVAVRARHPDICVTIVGETRYASLDRREADVAVRMTKPEQGNFVISKLGEVAFGFYATAAYLAATPEAQRTFIAYDETMASAPQSIRLAEATEGRKVTLRATTLEFQLAAARASGGIAMLPNFMLTGVDDLVEAIPQGQPLTRELWLVVHADIRTVPIIRVVMDALKSVSWSGKPLPTLPQTTA